MALNLPFGIQPVNALSNLDVRYGPWANTSAALTNTAGTRVSGLTVGIIEAGGIVEYWFKNGIADGNLVVKSSSGIGGSGIGWSNLAAGSTVAGCGTVASGSSICRNTFYGVNAGCSITSGTGNTSNGYQALRSITTGCGNVAIGHQALYSNATGNTNFAIGCSALYANTIGFDNIAIGNDSLRKNISGGMNIGIGYCTLNCNLTGSQNIAIGGSALICNNDGYNNIAIGTTTMVHNISGYNNIAIGNGAVFSNESGCENIGQGNGAMVNNTTGNFNIALGYQSLQRNTNGNNNVAIGRYSLSQNQYIHRSVAIGCGAGYSEGSSDRLHIANCDTCSLIYGEFVNKIVCIDNKLITCNLQVLSGVTTGYVLTADATGNATWQAGGGSSLSIFTITGNSSATGFTVNHAKNKQFVGVEIVKNSSPYQTVYTDVQRTNANCIYITFDTAPSTGQQYKILITG